MTTQAISYLYMQHESSNEKRYRVALLTCNCFNRCVLSDNDSMYVVSSNMESDVNLKQKSEPY